MNNKIAWGIVVAVIVIVGAFLLLRPSGAPSTATAPAQNASSTSPGSSLSPSVKNNTQPTITVGTSTVKTIAPVTSFDSKSLISTSAYPTITGTANVSQIGIIISNSKGVGVVGSSDVAVVNGHWSYADSAKLPSGSYTIILFVGKTITAGAALTVR